MFSLSYLVSLFTVMAPYHERKEFVHFQRHVMLLYQSFFFFFWSPCIQEIFQISVGTITFFFVGKNSRHCRNSSGSTFCLAEMATKDKEIYGYRFERYNKSIGTCSFIAHRRCARRVSIMTSDKTKP